MRFAFITPEFVTDYPDGGGLGNYLNRITKILVHKGHEVELFIPSDLEPRVLSHNGVRVERVNRNASAFTHFATKVLGKLPRTTLLLKEIQLRSKALNLANAMEQRHSVSPFDLVQSADYLAVGLKVKKRSDRVHVIRCSCAIDLYHQVDGRNPTVARLQERLEFEAIRRADLCYSPCRFTSKHYSEILQREIGVIRTPRSLEVSVATDLPFTPPRRYLIFFGQFIRRKGIDWLIDSLKIAFDKDSSLRFVLVGAGDGHALSRKLRVLLPHRDKLVVLYQMPKAQLLNLIRGAEASVLPSLVDNLPNTVIESLTLGVPVIGSDGASIDELVTDGVHGRLVPIGNSDRLADAMLEVWQGKAPFKPGFVWDSETAREMTDENVVESLLSLAKTRSFHR